MIRILIVEDEKIAARHLKKMIEELLPEMKISGITDTINATINWLKNNDMPDLAFFDIQLADGISFEIFKQFEITCPVIFTTAYDEYALKAFEVNSIDYLLKPIIKEKLQRALRKYENWIGKQNKSIIDINSLQKAMELIKTKEYKERFVVKFGEHLKSISADEISCFLSESKATFFISTDKRRYLVDYSLDEIASMINPHEFFRINRKFIIRVSSIKDIIAFSNSRLKLILHELDHPDLIVAREKVQEFRQWLDR